MSISGSHSTDVQNTIGGLRACPPQEKFEILRLNLVRITLLIELDTTRYELLHGVIY